MGLGIKSTWEKQRHVRNEFRWTKKDAFVVCRKENTRIYGRARVVTNCARDDVHFNDAFFYKTHNLHHW